MSKVKHIPYFKDIINSMNKKTKIVIYKNVSMGITEKLLIEKLLIEKLKVSDEQD